MRIRAFPNPKMLLLMGYYTREYPMGGIFCSDKPDNFKTTLKRRRDISSMK